MAFPALPGPLGCSHKELPNSLRSLPVALPWQTKCLPLQSGGQKSGLVPPEAAGPLRSRTLSLSCWGRSILGCCPWPAHVLFSVCAVSTSKVSPSLAQSYRTQAPMTYFYLDDPCKGPIAKSGHVLKSWILRLRYTNGGHSAIHRTPTLGPLPLLSPPATTLPPAPSRSPSH